MQTLWQNWKETCSLYCSHQLTIENWFDKLTGNYSTTERYYHNLDHISSMLEEIQHSQFNIKDKNTLFFATWFHDIIYTPTSSTNETESAREATLALQQLGVDRATSVKVRQLILATAKHTDNVYGTDPLLDFFLDCDLKILGAPYNQYQTYAKDIRMEYQKVVSFLYNKGRKKVLQRFLAAQSIFRTTYFKENYETQARYNITHEIEQL